MIEHNDGGTWLVDLMSVSLNVLYPYDFDELSDKISFELISKLEILL